MKRTYDPKLKPLFLASVLWCSLAGAAPSSPPFIDPPGAFPDSRGDVHAAQRANWSFRQPGRTIEDRTGRGHTLETPAVGARGGFFGIELDGRGRFELPDHPDFALKPPFTLEVQAHPGAPAELTHEAILLERGDGSGAKAYSLRLLPGGRVRFAMQGNDGKTAAVEGKLAGGPRFAPMLHLFVTLDDAGELTLRDVCEVLGRTKTSLRPRLVLDAHRAPALRIAGSSLEEAGFGGELVSVILERGFPEFHEQLASAAGPLLSAEMLAHFPPEVRERMEKERAYQVELRKMQERHFKELEELRTQMLGAPPSPAPARRAGCSWGWPKRTFTD